MTIRALRDAPITIVAILLLASCTTNQAQPARPNPTSTTPATATATAKPVNAALNRQLTTAETIRLVGLVDLPPNSSATTVQPSSLSSPAGGTPASASLIDTVRYWRVPLSYAQAVSWLASPHPGGLKLGGTAGRTGQQIQFSGYMFTAPDSGVWTQASLDIGIEPSANGGSLWRIDGLALWVDPQPLADASPGQALHFTVAAGCPASDRGVTDISNTGSGLTDSLLPAGAPSAGLICAYSGGNGTPFALKVHRLLAAGDADSLAQLARSVSLAHVDDEMISCPAEDGAATLLAFSYSDRADVNLWIAEGGCGGGSNGDVSATAINNTSFEQLYEAVHRDLG